MGMYFELWTGHGIFPMKTQITLVLLSTIIINMTGCSIPCMTRQVRENEALMQAQGSRYYEMYPGTVTPRDRLK